MEEKITTQLLKDVVANFLKEQGVVGLITECTGVAPDSQDANKVEINGCQIYMSYAKLNFVPIEDMCTDKHIIEMINLAGEGIDMPAPLTIPLLSMDLLKDK